MDVSPAQVDTYRRDGFFIVERMFSPAEDVTIQPDTLREMAQRGDAAALTGPAGTVAFMHCALVHSSTENISTERRALFALMFNPVDNRPQHLRREPYTPAQVEPLRPLADDCVLTTAS